MFWTGYFLGVLTFMGLHALAVAIIAVVIEPMPPGEETFRYHGYSGPCPKPPIPKEQASHAYRLVISWGEDAPNKTLDLIYFCPTCGTVKHDYRHNGGQTSSNYPQFLTKGVNSWTTPEPKCQQEEQD